MSTGKRSKNMQIDVFRIFYIIIEGFIKIFAAMTVQQRWLIVLPFLLALLVAVNVRRPIDFLISLGVAATTGLLMIFAVIFTEALMGSL
jgi:hypothetical protein